VSILDEPVLVLNRSWQPVTFLPVKVAIVNSMRDMASCLDTENYLLLTFEEWSVSEPKDARWIKTAHSQIPAPEVIVLKKYGERPPRKVNFNRVNMARRDEFTCQYCGSSLGIQHVTIDHVLPRSKGGGTTWENCVAACGDCNSRKADLTTKEARMPLRKKPTVPTFKAPILRVRSEIRASWQPFLQKEAVAV
jgi:5-methylcytosine-specific restriction endonuclease McrA